MLEKNKSKLIKRNILETRAGDQIFSLDAMRIHFHNHRPHGSHLC